MPGGRLPYFTAAKMNRATPTPAACAWNSWSSSERTTRETTNGPLVEWSAAEEVSPGVVQLTARNYFVDADEALTERQTLRFRELTALELGLRAAGFTVNAVYGDWQRGPVADSSTVLVVVATAR